MNIPKGYKMTEVGVIPEDWRIVSLKDIGTFSKGGGISREQSNTGTLPAIRYGELYVNQHDYIRRFYSHVSPEIAQTAKLIKRGDILFTASGETKEDIGKSVAYDGNEEAYAGGDLIIFTPKIDCVPIFMGYLLNTQYVRSQKALRGQGDAVVHITTSSIGDIKIALPKVEEQQRIADALIDIDRLIEPINAEIEKKRQIKEGAMQALLTGKKRLPGYSGEWVEKKFNDFISRFATGLNPRNNFTLNSGGYYYYVTIKDFKDGVLFFSGCDKIDGQALKLINERSDLRIGDLLFSSIGRIGDAYVIKEEPKNWNINESVFNLRPNKDVITSDFLYYLIKSEKVQDLFKENTTGSTLKSVKMGHLKEIVCFFPSDLKEQSAIAQILKDIDAEILALEAERDKYMLIKQGMMQELLTGKTRLV